jgi:hypothetical protein
MVAVPLEELEQQTLLQVLHLHMLLVELVMELR